MPRIRSFWLNAYCMEDVLMKTTLTQSNITCTICDQYLDPGSAVLDETGKAAHEDCYIQSISVPQTCEQDWAKAA
jgi:hypothetical protein